MTTEQATRSLRRNGALASGPLPLSYTITRDTTNSLLSGANGAVFSAASGEIPCSVEKGIFE
jgi:hypothetical protein